MLKQLQTIVLVALLLVVVGGLFISINYIQNYELPQTPIPEENE